MTLPKRGMPAGAHRIRQVAAALLGRRSLERDLDDEVRLHLELEAEELVRMRGLAPAEARRQAAIAFGGVERWKEAHRDARGVRWLEELSQDLRYSLRGLIRSPGYFLACTLLLTLGIGGATAMFSAVHAVLLAQLPYRDPDELVRIYQRYTNNQFGVSVVDVQAVIAQQRTMSAVGAVRLGRVALSAGGELERVLSARATAGFLEALDVRPARGRALQPDDDRPDAPPVVIVSDAYARRALGGAAAAVGRSVTIDGKVYGVVGVLPDMPHNPGGVAADVWTPARFPLPERRGPFGIRMVGRLRAGATLADAERDLAGISERIFPQWASSFQDSMARLTPVPLRTTIIGDAGKTLWIFTAAAGLVLLIAVVNVASLTMVRSAGRSREVNLRTVLGATRARLLRLMLTESLVLSLIGAATGIAAGAAGLRVLGAVLQGMPRLAEAHLDLSAIAFAVAAALIAGVVIGAYPVALLLGRTPAGALQHGARSVGAGRGTRALRAVFVIGEFALALPLLAGAGLLLNSFVRLQRVDPGFDPARIATMTVSLPGARYGESDAVAGFWARALPRVREVPGVAFAGLADAVPPDDGNVDVNNFDLADRPVSPGQSQPVAHG